MQRKPGQDSIFHVEFMKVVKKQDKSRQKKTLQVVQIRILFFYKMEVVKRGVQKWSDWPLLYFLNRYELKLTKTRVNAFNVDSKMSTR